MKEILLLVVFVVASWLGYKVIKEVPPLLHTPLMSGTNAISGVTILGSLVSTAHAVSSGSKIWDLWPLFWPQSIWLAVFWLPIEC